MTRLLPVDIDGLNLVLGGGVALLKRHPDYDESATLLIRGAPGSGKTILGVQLAGSIARSLDCDVAYGCVELLPSELRAQHEGIKSPYLSEKVVVAPFPAKGGEGTWNCRIFAEVLDLGASGEETSRLGEAVERLLKAVEEAGGRPRVLVIDSLSDGYNLGASAPRVLADALCKLAVLRGMVLILLEEIGENKPSVWSFAADTVFELRLEREDLPGTPLTRSLAVTKHRFNACQAGPHRVMIVARHGVDVLPELATYLAPWARPIVFPRPNLPSSTAISWSPPAPKALQPDWPSFSECVTAVHGSESKDVFRLVFELGVKTSGASEVDGFDVLLDFNHEDPEAQNPEWHGRKIWYLGCGVPTISGEWLLAMTTRLVRGLLYKGDRIRRVLIGDLQSLRTFQQPALVRQALMLLASSLRREAIPVVMFETSAPRRVERVVDKRFAAEETGAPAPWVVDLADVVFEVMRKTPDNHSASPNVFMTHVRTGRVHQWG